MVRKFHLRLLLGSFKDKASIIKASLSSKRRTASIRLSVIRATKRTSTSPPQHRIDAVLAFGHISRPTASACIHAIMDRAHKSRNAYVVFKSLIIIHNIITRGSFILKDQLSIYPSTGGRNYLNLSMFSDKSNVKTWEFSTWIRWYARFLELNLMTSRVLGSYLSSSSSSFTNSSNNNVKDFENLTGLLSSDLIKEIKALVDIIEEICRAPNDSSTQQNNLVYEAMKLVSEDYRSTQQKIYSRLTELEDRVKGLNSGELDELINCLKKVEESKERLVDLFVNRKRNDAFWELISQTRINFLRVKKERESVLAISESTRLDERVVAPSRMVMRLLPYGGGWMRGESTRVLALTTSTM
ncbi:hypothetical protein DCAR_0522089 [Daucus carota subsp. sativus]|uniref:Uncharacterized protein n=1 Tax=Daucus carota subsp. sativus TaxID=79200 RepID=A0A164ZKX7_DAUCS|nr:PREDICTED: putative clathrin assembly protein At4g40080 [Daucus carota subsp. sativus]WOH02700.1 hypothetical protein DCAR_0522089 [Daucus carota subsp. sativus]